MQKLFLWVEHNETSLVEFHDVKTKTSMSCKELFDKQCPFAQYIKSGNTWF